MAEKKSRDGRTRLWTFIVYPESAPEDWRDRIDETHSPYAVSPLHDRDINADGTPKKPHWHVFLSFEGVKSYEQVLEIAQAAQGTIPQRVESAKGMARYLAHLDNPDKAQYDRNLIETHGGLDIAEYLEGNKADSRRICKEIIEYVIENDITEYEDIITYAMYNNDEWFDALRTECTYVVNSFIKSRRHRKEREQN